MTVSRHVCAFGAAVVALAGLFWPAGQAVAATPPPSVIAVIDMQFLLNNSTAGKNIREQVDIIRAKYQAEINPRETALRAEENELRRQQTVLSPEAFAEKRRQFQVRIAAHQRYIRDFTKMSEDAVGKATGEVQKVIFVILGELRAKYGFNLVLDRSRVVFVTETTDLSDEVLKQLDQRLPKVNVQFPAQ